MRIIHAIAIACVSAASPGSIRKMSRNLELETDLMLMDRFGNNQPLSAFTEDQITKLRSLAEYGSGRYLAGPNLTGESDMDEHIIEYYDTTLRKLRAAFKEHDE